MNDSVKNHAVIGAFVVGAAMLVVAAVVVFGGGKLFRDTSRYVMFFQGSVKGLSIGSPVTFRGVKIGSVMDISLRADPKNLELCIPVVIEIDKGNIERSADASHNQTITLQQLIDIGLRAKLDIHSIITGQLLINLELMPDEPKRLMGFKHPYMEIPTVPNTLERITRQFEELPVKDMLNNVSTSLKSLEILINDPALPEIIQNVNRVTANLVTLSETLNRRTEPLLGSLQNVSGRADAVMIRLDTAVDSIQKASESLARLADSAEPAVDRAGRVLDNMAGMTDPSARERHEFRTMINELAEAARAVRVLSHYLERHPEALIKGKK